MSTPQIFLAGVVCGLALPLAVRGVLAAVAALSAAVRRRRRLNGDAPELRRSVERAERSAR